MTFTLVCKQLIYQLPFIIHRNTTLDYFSRIACNNCVVWDIFGNNTSSTHYNMISYFKSWKDNTSNTYYSIIPNMCIYLYSTTMIMC